MTIEDELAKTRDQWTKGLLNEALSSLFDQRNALVLFRGRTFISMHLSVDAAEGTIKVLDPQRLGDWRLVPAVLIYPRQKRVRAKKGDSNV